MTAWQWIAYMAVSALPALILFGPLFWWMAKIAESQKRERERYYTDRHNPDQ